MSIHRPKRVSHRSSRDSDNPLDSAPPDKPMSWTAATEGKADADFKAYSVKTTFAQGDLLRHPKFGNGVVVGVESSKIDVMFEDGERKLVHAMV
jgi:hypothetical protein